MTDYGTTPAGNKRKRRKLDGQSVTTEMTSPVRHAVISTEIGLFDLFETAAKELREAGLPVTEGMQIQWSERPVQAFTTKKSYKAKASKRGRGSKR